MKGKKIKCRENTVSRVSSSKRIMKQVKRVIILPIRKKGSKGVNWVFLKNKTRAIAGIKSWPPQSSTSQ